MKNSLSVGIIVFLPLLSWLSLAQQEHSGAGGLIDNLHCTDFEWLPAAGISDKAALRIPILLDKRTYWYQLDTGSDATVLYGTDGKRWGWEQGQRFVRVLNVKVGGLEIPAILASVRPEMKADPKDTEGTVGLDVLIGNIVVLDFPNKHFCMVPPCRRSARYRQTHQVGSGGSSRWEVFRKNEIERYRPRCSVL
jgi:hypothetical protein